MKKSLILFLLVLIFRTTSTGQNAIDSIIVSSCYHNDLDIGQFYTQKTDSFSNGLLMSTYFQDTTNVFFLLDKYFYSPTNKLLEHQYGAYVNSVFTMQKQEIYNYDSNDSIITYFNWSLNSTDYRETFSRDVSGKVIKKVSEYYISSWVTYVVEWYYYTLNDSIEYIISSFPQATDSLYSDHTYDSLQNSLTIQQFYWNPSTLAFDDTSDRTMYYYDSLDRIIAKTEAWYFNSQWWEVYDTTYWIYDNLNRIDYVENGVIPHVGYWEDYIYDSATSLLDSLNYCQWATHSGRCKYCKYNFYSFPLSVADIEEEQFILFPNPASEELNIFFSDNRSLKVRISIRNVYSQILFDVDVFLMNGTARIPVQKHAPGVYFVTLEMNGNKSTKKIILE